MHLPPLLWRCRGAAGTGGELKMVNAKGSPSKPATESFAPPCRASCRLRAGSPGATGLRRWRYSPDLPLLSRLQPDLRGFNAAQAESKVRLKRAGETALESVYHPLKRVADEAPAGSRQEDVNRSC